MSTTNQFFLALQAYQEIQAKLRRESHILADKEIARPEASTIRAMAFSGSSLLVGLADDGSPVLFDLYDPAAGPVLVAGDGGSGKTAFLQSLARASNLPDPGDVQFGVLTLFPEEWTALESLPNCLGIWPAYHPSAVGFLSQLVSWAEVLPETRQVVFLLFDGLDLMTGSSSQYQPDLRWLLTHGPERQIWPVISVNPARMRHLRSWLDYFHTRVIGRVKNGHNARLLMGEPTISLADLFPGRQFVLSRPDGWLKFWLPPVE